MSQHRIHDATDAKSFPIAEERREVLRFSPAIGDAIVRWRIFLVVSNLAHQQAADERLSKFAWLQAKDADLVLGIYWSILVVRFLVVHLGES
jgi:hypothetical protein